MRAKAITTDYYSGGHVQGVAVDEKRGYAYFSYTTKLIKTTLDGKLVGSAVNLIGHLGCITLLPDGSVVGSLEYKNDAIGRGIAERNNTAMMSENAFYLVRFDTEKITQADMDAETTGVMSAVYLRKVAQDFEENDEASGKKHRYGCSGIDGTGYGPLFGEDGEKHILVCYGVYSDNERTDNDYQVIHAYPYDIFEKHGQPLLQSNPHHCGPTSPHKTYFLFTGNTTYGVQNLEYDVHSKKWFFCVYPGKKPIYTNFYAYTVDGEKKPVLSSLAGRGGEIGLTVKAEGGITDKSGKTSGYTFPYGMTGIASMGDGEFYISHPVNGEGNAFSTTLRLYRLTCDDRLFEEIK